MSDAQQKADAKRVLAEIGEAVVYRFGDGSTRPINAIIERGPSQQMEEVPLSNGGVRNGLTAWIFAGDATDGVTSIEPSIDSLDVSAQYGGTAEKHIIADIEVSTAAWWKVVLR